MTSVYSQHIIHYAVHGSISVRIIQMHSRSFQKQDFMFILFSYTTNLYKREIRVLVLSLAQMSLLLQRCCHSIVPFDTNDDCDDDVFLQQATLTNPRASEVWRLPPIKSVLPWGKQTNCPSVTNAAQESCKYHWPVCCCLWGLCL